MSQTYTPETLAAEMEKRSTVYSAGTSARLDLMEYAAAVRALAERQPAPEPERRWEHQFVWGMGFLHALNAGGELVGSVVVLPCEDGDHSVGGIIRRRVAAPAVPAADAELRALRAERDRYKNALEHYADESFYEPTRSGDSPPVTVDLGDIARHALEVTP